MSTPVQHHPDIDDLVEFSAGAMSPGPALCISTHLEFCDQCRQRVDGLNELGSALLESIDPVSVTGTLLENVWSLIEQAESGDAVSKNQSSEEKALAHSELLNIPRPLRSLVRQGWSQLPWEKISSALDMAVLPVGDTDYQVALSRTRPGHAVGSHDHRGREWTVVIDGAFSDSQGVYQNGDLKVCDSGQVHNPVTSQGGDCLCLTAQQGPIKFTGWRRILNPWLLRPV